MTQDSRIQSVSQEYAIGFAEGKKHGYNIGFRDGFNKHRGGMLKFLRRAIVSLMAGLFLLIIAFGYDAVHDIVNIFNDPRLSTFIDKGLSFIKN